MELSCQILEQIVFNTRPKLQNNMLNVKDKSNHEEHLYQPLQINNKHFEIAVTFQTGYNGYFSITTPKIDFYFTKLLMMMILVISQSPQLLMN